MSLREMTVFTLTVTAHLGHSQRNSSVSQFYGLHTLGTQLRVYCLENKNKALV